VGNIVHTRANGFPDVRASSDIEQALVCLGVLNHSLGFTLYREDEGTLMPF
jgi:hypothetical protein